MSNRNLIACCVGAFGFVSVILGITFISAYNHAKDTADAHAGGWMLGIGLLLAFGSVLISDREVNRIHYDEELDGDNPSS